LPGACKAAFENALFVYSDAPPGDAPGREDHLEVERKTPPLSNARRKAPLRAELEVSPMKETVAA
jgi:hypothetical protein